MSTGWRVGGGGTRQWPTPGAQPAANPRTDGGSAPGDLAKLARDQRRFLAIFAVKVTLGLVAFAVKPWLGLLFLAAYFWREIRAGAGGRATVTSWRCCCCSAAGRRAARLGWTSPGSASHAGD